MIRLDPVRAVLTPFIRKGFPRTRGEIRGLPLSAPVEVLRDSLGIPHIYAANAHDLFAAQGFVHAQDRLWQMHSIRMVAQGRLSEAAGPRMTELDYLCRLLGFPSLRRSAADAAEGPGREALTAYAEGVNANIALRGRDLPLEFRAAGITPEPWVPGDSMSFLALVSWQMLYIHYHEKLCALACGERVTEKEWNDIFPSSPGAVLPAEPWFGSLSRLKLGPLHPAARAFDTAFGTDHCSAGTGSNNWAVSRSSDGKPLLANDPHLGIVLPATWYFCHLDCPSSPGFPQGINAAGASVAGCPCVAIGRNQHAAWGFTSLMLDAADILILRVDPRRPTRYVIEGREKEMEREEVTLHPRGRAAVSLPLYRTDLGPVLTAVEEGAEAVAVLRWYGTLPGGILNDHALRGLLAFNTARSVDEVMAAGEDWKWLSWNIVAADDTGRIGWHACGAAPLRRGYSGRLPADGSAGADWSGFLPYADMPHRVDPQEGWLATANNKVTEDGARHPLSYAWHGPYRHRRICSVVSAMREPGIEDFAGLHADTRSAQADVILPALMALEPADPAAREARLILAGWDRNVGPDSRGAALFEMFLCELTRRLLDRPFKGELSLYASAVDGWSLVDVILERPQSTLWPDCGPAGTVDACLIRAMERLESALGRDRSRWRWGSLHRYVFRHPGAASPFLARVLNPDPLPAGGDCNTVNVSWFRMPCESCDVTVIPSLRMIVPLGDPDGMRIIGPLGQSGQPGHKHYTDMHAHWAACRYTRLPLGRREAEKAAVERLILRPGDPGGAPLPARAPGR
jgi:penicillin G amidase